MDNNTIEIMDNNTIEIIDSDNFEDTIKYFNDYNFENLKMISNLSKIQITELFNFIISNNHINILSKILLSYKFFDKIIKNEINYYFIYNFRKFNKNILHLILYNYDNIYCIRNILKFLTRDEYICDDNDINNIIKEINENKFELSFNSIQKLNITKQRLLFQIKINNVKIILILLNYFFDKNLNKNLIKFIKNNKLYCINSDIIKFLKNNFNSIIENNNLEILRNSINYIENINYILFFQIENIFISIVENNNIDMFKIIYYYKFNKNSLIKYIENNINVDDDDIEDINFIEEYNEYTAFENNIRESDYKSINDLIDYSINRDIILNKKYDFIKLLYDLNYDFTKNPKIIDKEYFDVIIFLHNLGYNFNNFNDIIINNIMNENYELLLLFLNNIGYNYHNKINDRIKYTKMLKKNIKIIKYLNFLKNKNLLLLHYHFKNNKFFSNIDIIKNIATFI
jgi:hypothetical protein